MKRTRSRSKAELEARRHFTETVLAAGYCVAHGAECEREIQDAHHLVKRARQVDALRPRRLSEDELLAITFDPRCGIRCCRPWHRKLDGHSFKHGEHTYLRAEQVPWEAITWAQDYGLERELCKAVPELSDVLYGSQVATGEEG